MRGWSRCINFRTAECICDIFNLGMPGTTFKEQQILITNTCQHLTKYHLRLIFCPKISR